MQDSRMMVMVAALERDQEAERKVVQEAIVGQGGVSVGMPYPAIPTNYIHKLNLHCMADADYVLLLIGTEYGPLTERGVGYIHTIYAAAQAARKPVLSLIYSGERSVHIDRFEQKRLDGLISSLKNGLIYYWHDADSLRDGIELGLENLFETYPSLGWVKADMQPLYQAMNPQDDKLIWQLRQRISQLEQRLKALKSADTPLVPSFVDDNSPWQARYQCNAFREGRLKPFDGVLTLDLSEVFQWASATLLSPTTETRVRALVASRLHDRVLHSAKKAWSGSHAVSDIRIDQPSFDEFKTRLRALGLISFDYHGRWQLTGEGEVIALRK
ncbi:DUF4062 domain-containing protein [Reinekea sp.]|uniref:DUF4062 domain-containing protein n=1 Tax=Reinekea sp. TaxID=1970455 RepID=UPI002A827209|nr:DUF4062 domain-containing protein [Reinekea sp.]